jgi:hypothetical protein
MNEEEGYKLLLSIKSEKDNKILEENLDTFELFINDFNLITDCLYESLNTKKADEYYSCLLKIKNYLENIYFKEEK